MSKTLQDQTVLVLSLCPMLVPANSLITGTAIGLIFFLLLILTSVSTFLSRGLIPAVFRLYILVLLAATMTAIIYLLVQACCYDLSLLLGIYFPLMAVNCVLLINNEEVALRHSFFTAGIETLKTGVVLVFLLAIIGFLRELFGAGTLLQHAELVFGSAASHWSLQIIDEQLTWNMMLSAPGAFFSLALILAFINLTHNKTEQQAG